MNFPLPCHVEDRAKTRVVETLVDMPPILQVSTPHGTPHAQHQSCRLYTTFPLGLHTIHPAQILQAYTPYVLHISFRLTRHIPSTLHMICPASSIVNNYYQSCIATHTQQQQQFTSEFGVYSSNSSHIHLTRGREISGQCFTSV